MALRATRTLKATTRRTMAAHTLPTLPTIPTLAALRRHATWLQREARVVEGNVAQLKAIYVRMGEASDWQDTRLPALDETIRFWQNRYHALIGQLTLTRALFVHLMTTPTPATPTPATPTTRVTPAVTAIDRFYVGPRGAQPIIREAW